MHMLARTGTLWLLLLATVALAAGFILWTPQVGGTILDSVAPANAVHALLERMSPAQKHAHFLMTLLLDMLYPLAYGGLFAGLALRFGGGVGGWLALPALVVIPVDMLENIIQMLALTGNESLLPVKAILTPAKFTLFALAGVIALATGLAALAGAIRRRPSRQAPEPPTANSPAPSTRQR